MNMTIGIRGEARARAAQVLDKALSEDLPFNVSRGSRSGAITGGPVDRGVWLDCGHLDGHEGRRFRTYNQQGLVDFVIWSYATPIAYRVVGVGVIVPNVRYSQSTGRHQSLLRMALPDGWMS